MDSGTDGTSRGYTASLEHVRMLASAAERTQWLSKQPWACTLDHERGSDAYAGGMEWMLRAPEDDTVHLARSLRADLKDVEIGKAASIRIGTPWGSIQRVERLVAADVPHDAWGNVSDVMHDGQLPCSGGCVVFDMDSTLLQMECIDRLAEEAGVGPAVRAVTHAAMGGDMDFTASLTQRVACLSGLKVTAVDKVRDNLVYTPGAAALVRLLRQCGCTTAVVSGGFTDMSAVVQQTLGMDEHHANELERTAPGLHEPATLTGRVRGPVVDPCYKQRVIQELSKRCHGAQAVGDGVVQCQTLAVGDGANDLMMLGAAHEGLAFCGKAAVRAAHVAVDDFTLLACVMLAFGMCWADIVATVGEDALVDTLPVAVPPSAMACLSG